MLHKLFPQSIDNTYSGSQLAPWFLGLIVFVHTLQSALVLFDAQWIAQSADGIPLDTYPPAAAQTFLGVFTVSAFRRLIISLLGAVVLFRYRSAIPAMFVVLGISYVAGQVILRSTPIVTGTSPGAVMNLVLFGLTVVGLALSLWTRADSRPVDRRSRPM